ncbi:MAG: very short patch repair endonuclease [Methanoregula sp.]|nr:MAG: very short patch repair endonuclease [Methanoregula sp.]
MTDCYSKEIRSRVMSNIHSKNTLPELQLRKLLWSKGFRGYRIHNKNLPGKPDIIFSSKKVAIFIDGCFWHGCPDCYVKPKSNKKYWLPKIQQNIERDLKNKKSLESMGWFVIRIWEHELKIDAQSVFKKISEYLQ